MGPTIVAGTKSAAPEAAAPAQPMSTPSTNESLPAISMHECELFHNHRDGVANELTILYGTDRDRVDKAPVVSKLWAGFCSSLMGSIFLTLGFGTTAFFAARKKALILATMGSGLFSVFLGYPIVADISISRSVCGERKPGYGVGRSDLQVGVCHVSVPPVHVPGQVERTNYVMLDLIPDPERHFLLTEVEPLSDDPFYSELRKQVAKSSKKDLFVFVHGYNVSFEAAALRTAQMKSDLEFEGAACFYSWPSQGGLLQYTRDEENVRYTLTHLKTFLNSLTQQSGAESIHIIAHSMGNRAVTDVLKEIRLELGKDKSKLFNQVILAAPDVDAQVFVNDIAPRIKDTADRVTLYASSNDRALIASKIVHGYPRAGESGRGMVIVDGVETVDVSNVDCSLLGHSYYGDSASVLTDLALVLRGKRPTLDRSWLTPDQSRGGTFWRFSQQEFATARRLAQQMR
jgi:esterase/lipase superfamily enzyme